MTNAIIESAREMAGLMLACDPNHLPPVVDRAIRSINYNVQSVRGPEGGLRSSQVIGLLVFLYEEGILTDG